MKTISHQLSTINSPRVRQRAAYKTRCGVRERRVGLGERRKAEQCDQVFKLESVTLARLAQLGI